MNARLSRIRITDYRPGEPVQDMDHGKCPNSVKVPVINSHKLLDEMAISGKTVVRTRIRILKTIWR